MQSKPLNFLYNIGQRNVWLIAVVTVLLLVVKLLGQLPYTVDVSSLLKINELPRTIDRVIHYAAFGHYEYSFIGFYGRLYYFFVILTWVMLIVGLVRYFSIKRSVTYLKLVALLVLWQGLFELVRLVYFSLFNPFTSNIINSYFSPSLVFLETVLPLLLSVLLLGLLSSTYPKTSVQQPEFLPLNVWQRGFHYFIDRLVIWFVGYNYYLIDHLFSGSLEHRIFGFLLFLSLLVVLPLVSEWLFGVTFTKIITGSEVVQTNGKPISLTQAIARSFIRIIPFGWISVFGKTPWIDRWTGTQVRYFSKDEPILRLYKCVQLGTGIVFFFGSWYLLTIASIALEINNRSESNTVFFPFLILFISTFFIPFLHSFWLATVVSHYRKLRDEKQSFSTATFFRAFYCWIPILNFYYLGAYLDEITSHMEHLDISEEENERISKKINQFSGVFGLTTLFVWGLFVPLFVNTSNKYAFAITGLISLCLMVYAFFAWNFSRALKNTVVKSDNVSELIDDLG